MNFEFRKWLEYDDDDHDHSHPDNYAIKLPVKRTIAHSIAKDVTGDVGSIFRKRMGSDMPDGDYHHVEKDPLQAFNDGQYLVVTIEEPYDPSHPMNINTLMHNAEKKATSNPKIIQALTNSRASFHTDQKRTDAKYITKNGQNFVLFTLRFKLNTMDRMGKMSSRIDQGFHRGNWFDDPNDNHPHYGYHPQ